MGIRNSSARGCLMKKTTKSLLLGLGMGIIIGVISEDPEGFINLMKALKKDEKIERVEIDITPKKEDQLET